MTVKSIAPKNFESLPELPAPAGYICVIREIESDSYRIEGTAQLGRYINRVLAETGHKFGIELVAILETADLTAAEADLQERYHARLGSDWLELDRYQLAALRRSILQIDAYASQYVTPLSVAAVSQASAAAQVSGSQALTKRRTPFSNRAGWKRPRPRTPLPDRRYGARSLRRNRIVHPDSGEYKRSFSDYVSQLFEDVFVNHPGKVIVVILLIMFVALGFLSQQDYVYPLRF